MALTSSEHGSSSSILQHQHATPPPSSTSTRTSCHEAVAAFVAKDLQATRSEYLFSVPQQLHQLLQDARDVPALCLVANTLLTSLPCAAWLLLTCHSHLLGLMYLVANYALYLQRFMLTLHVTEHRRLFKKEFHGLNQLVPYLLCPLYGVPPGLYRTHHVVMHHVEDNQAWGDASSTELFQRDNLLHFMIYWFRFWVGAWFELPIYSWRHKRLDLLATNLSSEATYCLVIAALWRFNWVGTLWTLVVPFFVSTLLLMFGNWSQHVFVDPYGLHDTYRSTYNCVACPDNQRTYNDGYHILHHLNSRTHWSELPKQLLASLDQHDEHDALVFHSIGFFDVGLAVFTGRLDFLARHILPCGPRQAARSHEEWVQLLRERLKPVPAALRGQSKKTT